MPKPDSKPSLEQIKALERQIAHDQAHSKPAEKLVKINVPFEEAVRQMAWTPPYKK